MLHFQVLDSDVHFLELSSHDLITFDDFPRQFPLVMVQTDDSIGEGYDGQEAGKR